MRKSPEKHCAYECDSLPRIVESERTVDFFASLALIAPLALNALRRSLCHLLSESR